jgi:hypothetical protein
MAIRGKYVNFQQVHIPMTQVSLHMGKINYLFVREVM